MSTIEKIQNLMDKYNLDTCKEAWAKKNRNYNANIVFLGAFSSGKTCLINTLLGTKLPIGSKPTTKAICFIIPDKKVGDLNVLALQDETTHEKRIVDAIEFDECLCGEKNGIAYVNVKPTNVIPEGTVFVDTPGEGSLSDESALTMSYLRNVDASVFCISIDDGCVKKTISDFLCSRYLTSVHPYFIFAVTMADLKSGKSQEEVRQRIVCDLKTLAATGRFNASNIEDRVILTSRKDPEGTQRKIISALDKFVLGNLKKINENRLSQNAEDFKVVIRETLQDLYDSMALDIKELRAKQDVIEEKKKALKKDIAVCEEKIQEFKNELPDVLNRAFDNHFGEFLDAINVMDYKAIGMSLSSDISANVEKLMKRKFGNLENVSTPSGFTSKLAMELPHLLERVNKWTNFASDVVFNGIIIAASAGVAGAVTGGLTAAGGAAAGAGGAAVKDVSMKAAAEVAKSVVKETAKEVAKEPGKLSTACGILAKVLDKVNFIKPLADIVGDNVKEGKIKTFKNTFVNDFGYQIGNELELQVNDIVIEPLNLKIKAEEANLKNVANDIDKASTEYLQQKNELKNDIAGLS